MAAVPAGIRTLRLRVVLAPRTMAAIIIPNG
jgi:hypothetical protein